MPASGRLSERTRLAVAGLHLSGQPLNRELREVDAVLVADTRTAARYRLLSLPLHPPRPALVRAGQGGSAIAVEVWELSAEGLGRFLAGLDPPMAIGRVELAEGGWVLGFTCEPWTVEGATDISAYGGWRAYRTAQAQGDPGPAVGTGVIGADRRSALSLPVPPGLPDWFAGLRSALDDKLGLQVRELTRERVVGQIPVAGNTQPFGLWHGGASCVLAETLASLGSLAHARPDRVAVGVDINATHHRAVARGHVTGTASALHLGRTLTSYEVVLRDDEERRVCTARVTCHLVRQRADPGAAPHPWAAD
jgi:1,4-dihydroxy-2-naphthoyl-CoA hydrolase